MSMAGETWYFRTMVGCGQPKPWTVKLWSRGQRLCTRACERAWMHMSMRMHDSYLLFC